jgi:hypothetical protein
MTPHMTTDPSNFSLSCVLACIMVWCIHQCFPPSALAPAFPIEKVICRKSKVLSLLLTILAQLEFIYYSLFFFLQCWGSNPVPCTY